MYFLAVGFMVALGVALTVAVGFTAAAYLGPTVTLGEGFIVFIRRIVTVGLTVGLTVALGLPVTVAFAVGVMVIFSPGGGVALNSPGYFGVNDAPGGGDTGPSVTLTGNRGLPCGAINASPLKKPRIRAASVITIIICTIFTLNHPLFYR